MLVVVCKAQVEYRDVQRREVMVVTVCEDRMTHEEDANLHKIASC